MNRRTHQPPRLARWLIELFLRDDLLEEVQGDLEEKYYVVLRHRSRFRAGLNYWFQVLNYLRPFAIKRSKRQSNRNLIMFRSNVKIAYRSMRRNKSYTAINILGLTIGMAFSCMLYVYVHNELTYDQFHTKSDRIQRIIAVDNSLPDNPRYYGQCMPPAGPMLVHEFPEVEQSVRLFQFTGQVVFRIGETNYQEREWYSADSNFFDVFDFEFVSGDPQTALKEPFSVVLNESAALRLFGQTDIVGQVQEFGMYGSVTITGVVKDMPDNSHLNFNMLFSQIRNDDNWDRYVSSWDRFGAYTYVVLSEGTDIESFTRKMSDFEDRHLASFEGSVSLEYQPIEEIYFGSESIEYGIESSHGQRMYIYIFASMGLFILFIACVNYINMATSNATFRSKEIGIRKAIGAFKGQLIGQFLTESILISFIAMILGLGLMDLVLPYFNRITGTSFDLTFETIGMFLTPLTLIALSIALLSGSYPAFHLSRLQTAQALHGGSPIKGGSAVLRKALVVFQFVLTITLIFSTLVINRQLSYVNSRDIGYNKERLVVIDINSSNVRERFQTMKSEFAAIPGVEHVGVSSRVPGEWKNIRQVYVQSSNLAADSLHTYFMGFDEGMLETYRFKMKSGAFFESNAQNDSTQVLLNESAVEALGLTDPVGSTITMNGGAMKFRVAGIIEDFNFQSLHEKIAPLVVGTWNNPVQVIDYFTLKVSGDLAQVLGRANDVHEKFDQHSPMEYNFLDERLADFYDKELKAEMISNMGAVLCIFVACLGLFGLASFTAQKRRKELGIRKILGAGKLNLFLNLFSSLARQIGVAFLIACPLAYWIMYDWLEAFQYRIVIGPSIFLLSGLIALGIALMTITYRSLKAVTSNPVDSLRTE